MTDRDLVDRTAERVNWLLRHDEVFEASRVAAALIRRDDFTVPDLHAFTRQLDPNGLQQQRQGQPADEQAGLELHLPRREEDDIEHQDE